MDTNTKNTFVERRKQKRYLSRDKSYAVLCIPGNTIGKIIDMSSSGLAFQYFSANDKLMDSHSLDIITMEKGLCLEHVPYELIDDFIIPYEHNPFDQLIMRRHCVKFNSLTNDHVTKIQSFLKEHGKSESNVDLNVVWELSGSQSIINKREFQIFFLWG